MAISTPEGDLPFSKDRQLKYFLRCLKTFLPAGYTSTDANRMTLAFFILASVDLLGALDTSLSAIERSRHIDWIYNCQLPSGGFRGFPGADFSGGDRGDGEPVRRTEENEAWDPANVPATFFALVSLLILKDDLSRVRRRECLRWLRGMQRADGSFGEVMGRGGRIEGTVDLRFCCCAAGIRYILRGKDEEYLRNIQDIDTDALARYVEKCQAYDGGFASSPCNESHGGLTYCAIGSLHFLGRLTPPKSPSPSPKKTIPSAFPDRTRFDDLIEWLAHRQTNELCDEEDFEEDPSAHYQGFSHNTTPQMPANVSADMSVEDRIAALPYLTPASEAAPDEFRWAGFNGRTNKLADTCYCFWVTASLAMLDRLEIVDADAMARFLTEKTQHIIGGFGKAMGDVPDILHSCLGLMALAITGKCGLPEVDPAFATSKRVREHLESLSWWTGKAPESKMPDLSYLGGSSG